MFTLEGTSGLLWFIVWLFVAFDDPASHPRISLAEKEYIESSIKTEGKEAVSTCIHIFNTYASPFVLGKVFQLYAYIDIHSTDFIYFSCVH